MSRLPRLDYAYSVGRVRALENKLVSRDVFLEAAGERDFNSALKIIFDAGSFLDEMNEISNSIELDQFIMSEEEALNKLSAELFLDDSFGIMFKRDLNPSQALSAAEDTQYSFIIDYYRHKIDLGNIKIFFRVKYLDYTLEKLTDSLMPGGFLDDSLFVRNFELNYSEISEKLYASPYQRLWNEAVDNLQAEETFINLERGIEDFLIQYLKSAKYIVFGPEPVFAYVIAKRMELQLIRLVFVGLITKIPSKIIKKRISETYV
ncbi:MAG: V-type ATPase subunit [Candidatus Aminicenantes bacterium]|nr:V-type ATPase subunit [Candidatus Aminicenantes bacterium]